MARAYLEVQNARVADEEHDHQVVVEMLAGIRARDAIYEDRAVRRGIDVDAIESCSVAGMRGNDLSGHVQSLRRMLQRAVVGRIGDHIVVFGRGNARLHRPPSLNGLAPIGFARDRAPDVAFRRAEAAFAVAEHLGHGAVAYEEVVPLAMVFEGPPEHRRTFVESQLGPLLNDPLGEDLLRSLEAYYRAGQSIASAARSLHVHRHTLEYRLNRVSALLKTDLREPGRRLFLELALALRPAIN